MCMLFFLYSFLSTYLYYITDYKSLSLLERCIWKAQIETVQKVFSVLCWTDIVTVLKQSLFFTSLFHYT